MIKRADIRDGALWIVQCKTEARLGIQIMGELAIVIDRISQRPRKACSYSRAQFINPYSSLCNNMLLF